MRPVTPFYSQSDRKDTFIMKSLMIVWHMHTQTHTWRWLIGCHEDFHLCRAKLGCMEPFLAHCWLTKELNADQGEHTGSILPPSFPFSFSFSILIFPLSLKWCNKGSSNLTIYSEHKFWGLSVYVCALNKSHKSSNQNTVTFSRADWNMGFMMSDDLSHP